MWKKRIKLIIGTLLTISSTLIAFVSDLPEAIITILQLVPPSIQATLDHEPSFPTTYDSVHFSLNIDHKKSRHDKDYVYLWDFNGDDLPEDTTDTPEIDHQFMRPGHYQVVAKILSSKRQSPILAKTIPVDVAEISMTVLKPRLLQNWTTSYDSGKKLFPDSWSDSLLIDERDGHKYSTILIQNKIWMAENLAYLPEVFELRNTSSDEKRYYVPNYSGQDVTKARESVNYKEYGVLYNWEASKQACPRGWNLPTEDDWRNLEEFLGARSDKLSARYFRADHLLCSRLKSREGWINRNGIDFIGFNAKPAGAILHNLSGRVRIHEPGEITAFLSIYEGKEIKLISRILSAQNNSFKIDRATYDDALSIRCVKLNIQE
jgi:uncharacterized protein (TIGR02145 family)